MWTGDPTYVNDPVFLTFYDRTVADYVDRWHLDLDHVMTRDRRMNLQAQVDPKNALQMYRGDPSYEENGDDFSLGIDLLAAQYAAYKTYPTCKSFAAKPKSRRLTG
jgi:hypothetical protein